MISDKYDNECAGGCGNKKLKESEKNPLCLEIGICENCLKSGNEVIKMLAIKKYIYKHSNVTAYELVSIFDKYGIDSNTIDYYLEIGYLIFEDVNKVSDINSSDNPNGKIDIKKKQKILSLIRQQLMEKRSSNSWKSKAKIKSRESEHSKLIEDLKYIRYKRENHSNEER